MASSGEENRICPTCSSRGTCSRSHKRGIGEELLALLLPVIKPYRCKACNWRGYMGVSAIARDRVTNCWMNSILYLLVLGGLIAVVATTFS